ncbi:Bug family tripartite tricarboxylate transporter substrate binding protein [Roseococcus pinisoli]|uniref:Tripartite tricarboxylate transporter substrate binding protein n=1 Tax=Roseococcus pinisoli TaxID=2835040 RepID=A0ABS5QIY7_9PROT|nr:tripartite tricarboxylate transporter substrate binding protein [Roseococcus pinisoli]MBS7813649.1 tripartite tricarboxylate transporter substrate binding protein [Roseococcus pinisoli]
MSLILSRRASLAGGLATLTTPALAQSRFPERPLRIIVPVAAGGISDTISRYLAETLRPDLGQPVVVENRPGANGILASEAIARSAPDGYTIGYMLYAAMTLNPLLIPSLSYRMTDFLPLTPTFKAPMVLAVGRNVPVNNVREFVDYVKRQGTLSYGTLGQASTGQILMEMLRGLTGIELENVGYRGETLAVTDMIGGNLPAVCISTMNALEQHRAGNAKIIGISTPERLPALPDLPTFAEAGFPIDYSYFHGLMMPAGTPLPVVERLHRSIGAALQSPELRPRLTPDMQPFVLSPVEFSAMLRQESSKLRELVQARGIRLE